MSGRSQDGLWDWSVRAYARPGVAEACLDLQDSYGQNVPFLLFAAWSGCAEPQVLTAATRIAEAWEEIAVAPLRAARRALKPSQPPIDDAARLALREAVKAAELQAERALLEALEPLAPAGPTGGMGRALQVAAAVWRAPTPPAAALAKLVSALA